MRAFEHKSYVVCMAADAYFLQQQQHQQQQHISNNFSNNNDGFSQNCDETCLTFATETTTTTVQKHTTNTKTSDICWNQNENNSMTKQLTTTTATNAAANIANNTNLAPKVISPATTPTTTTTTTSATTGSSGGSGGSGGSGSSSSGVGSTATTTPQSAATSPTPTPMAIILPATATTTTTATATTIIKTPTSNTTGSTTTATATGARQKLVPSDAANTSATATPTATTTTTLTPATPATTTTKTKTTTNNAANDASGRSAALERAYVHDVYENCEEPSGPIRPRVAQFLSNLDPGSVVCDVGCGSGRYLTQCNPAICTVGVDRCHRLSKVAHEKGGEVALCDNLELPFRDECFDAVLSLAVVHHFATTERRVSALRELARILRIGGRVVITVWALEQRHRRFESQDVLIPWQPPKNRNFSYSDDEDDDDFLPPYHAYTEDSTNSSRSAGDGDSSSLSSSSPGESCYSFVRRAIQKLAGGRRHAWFLDSWTSKDTKNDSSLDYEDAKDLPIELRRLEDFEDFPDPLLSASLKSRSLGSILQPPPRQIVRSRSSVPSLGGPLLGGIVHNESLSNKSAQFLSAYDATQQQNGGGGGCGSGTISTGHSPTHGAAAISGGTTGSNSLGRRPKLIKQKQSLCDEDYQLPDQPFHMISNYNASNQSVNSSLYTKSGCYPSALTYHQHASSGVSIGTSSGAPTGGGNTKMRKQSSLNEELMAGNRLREKERVRKRIQKQTSLNEAFLCRSAMFSKRLQVIREGFTSKIKSSTGSLERVTKTGLVKIMQNLKTSAAGEATAAGIRPQNGNSSGGNAGTGASSTSAGGQQHGKPVLLSQHSHGSHHHHHHHHHHHIQQQQQPTKPNGVLQAHFSHLLHKQSSTTTAAPVSATAAAATKFSGPVTYCNSSECSGPNVCYCSAYHQECSVCAANPESEESKARRHSRESGSDSSKDSSLQSDTSIESEDSFASVIFIPKPEQHQQQLNYQQQHQNSNSSSSNSSSSNGAGACPAANSCCQASGNCTLSANGQPSAQAHHNHQAHHFNQQQQQQQPQQNNNNQQRIPSVPTSPLIMPCPPTPAHSPAATQMAVTSPPQTMAAVTGAMAILTPPMKLQSGVDSSQVKSTGTAAAAINLNGINKNRFNFDEAHIKEQATQDQLQAVAKRAQTTSTLLEANKTLLPVSPPTVNKITRQSIKDLPPIPKFRKQQSLQLQRQSFPIIRRASGSNSAGLPSIPKLLSLELFNPATDDLDSDSSEPSSPDSIDSVISAPRSANLTTTGSVASTQDISKLDSAGEADSTELPLIKTNQETYHNGGLKINSASSKDMILNDDSNNLLPMKPSTGGGNGTKKPQDCAEFAEQLSAQLQRELDEKRNPIECRSLDGIGDIAEFLEDTLGTGGSSGSTTGSLKKRSGADARDLTAIREELRERRLMLANLSTQPSLQQSPTSSSTSSLSSQTRSFTIHEEDEEEEDEDENERSYTLQLYENCKISKFNYKRNRHYNLNPETAYLLQDDGDSSSVRDDDDEVEHDVIPEEDEDAEALEAKGGDQLGEGMHDYARKSSRNTIKCDSFEDDDESASKSLLGKQTAPAGGTAGVTKHTQQQKQPQQQQSLPNRQSTESWEHSNSSTTSLDSPSQGGATTHHRYYHVFREGELDALINHHVASLHIVSSYYERASWCVVAEKVQVWTI